MTTPFDLLSTGLQTQTFEEIFEELGQNLQSAFGPTLNTTLSSVNGQFMRIMSELRAADQQAWLNVYRSFDPNSATGTALDARAALTGSLRKGASSSTVEGILTFNAAGVVADGTQVSNDDTGTVWETINGPYTDTGGPYPEQVAAQVQAVNTGPLIAPAGTTWSLVTVLAFIDSFTNPVEDATLGRNLETDAEFRYRRTVELFSKGQGPLATIAGIVSQVDTANGRVDTVQVYHNPATNPVDADGIPFKAFNVVVETTPSPPPAALQQDIFDAILTATGAGGEAYGTDFVGTALDLENQVQNVAFDLVDDLDIFQQITIETAFTTGGDLPVVPSDLATMATVIQEAVVEAAQDRTRFNRIGRDYKEIDTTTVITELITSGQLQGVDTVEVDLSTVSKTGPFTADFVTVGIRQRPDIDSGEIRILIDGVVYIA